MRIFLAKRFTIDDFDLKFIKGVQCSERHNTEIYLI
jgi:hypothetical protein